MTKKDFDTAYHAKVTDNNYLKNQETGSAVFWILIILVVIAGAGYFAYDQYYKPNFMIEETVQIHDPVEVNAFIDSITAARIKLENANCANIDYTPPLEQDAESDKSCFLFHPDGGNVVFKEFGVSECTMRGFDLTKLKIGESACDVVFAGTHDGNRLYTTAEDSGAEAFSFKSELIGATSNSNGKENTDLLISFTGDYNAAEKCRSLGPDWYLPSVEEMEVLYENREKIGNFILTGKRPEGLYWTSSESFHNRANRISFGDGEVRQSFKTSPHSIRCVRQ